MEPSQQSLGLASRSAITDGDDMGGDERLTRDERRAQVLAEAARLLSAFAFEWQKGLTLGELSVATGIDAGDISRDFDGKAGLIDELVDYCLNPDNFANFGDEWAGDLLAEVVSRLLDPDRDLQPAIEESFDIDLDYVAEDRRLRAQMAIWALSLDDPRARARLHTMYRFYDDQHQQVISGLLDEINATGAERVGLLSAEELVTVLTSLVEGLAIRRHVSPDDVTDGLMGRAAATLFASAHRMPDTGEPRIDEHFAEIDRRRRSQSASPGDRSSS